VFSASAIAAIAAAQAANQMASQDRHRLDALYGYSFVGISPRKVWAVAPPKPCRYCGRTDQTVGHKSCDGCGAPR
jgi:hypothetical protein